MRIHTMLFFQNLFGDLAQAFQHTITGAIGDHKIIGKCADSFDIQQQDILRLFLFQRIYNSFGKFNAFQISPLVRSGFPD